MRLDLGEMFEITRFVLGCEQGFMGFFPPQVLVLSSQPDEFICGKSAWRLLGSS